jgi:hypothetical protein
MSTPFDLQTNEAGELVLIDERGLRHEDVRPARVFPLTEPQRWIAIQNSGGVELACIEDPGALGESQRTALELALARRDFIPVIRAIHRISRATDGHEWQVTTDRGPTTFRVENDESIQNLGSTRLVIIDNRNTRYLIPNITALDRDSRRKLERYH